MPFLSRFRKEAPTAALQKPSEAPEIIEPKAKSVGVVARLMGLEMSPAEPVFSKSKQQAGEILKFMPDDKPSSRATSALAGLPPFIPLSDNVPQNESSYNAKGHLHSMEKFPASNDSASRSNSELRPKIHPEPLMQPLQLEGFSEELMVRQAEVCRKLNEARLLLKGDSITGMHHVSAADRPSRSKDLTDTLNFLQSNKNILLTDLGQRFLLGASLAQASKVMSQKDEQNWVPASQQKMAKGVRGSAINSKPSSRQAKGVTKPVEAWKFSEHQIGSNYEQGRGNIECAFQHQKGQRDFLAKQMGNNKRINMRDAQENQRVPNTSLRKGQIIKPLTSPTISTRFYAEIPESKEAVGDGIAAFKRAFKQETRKDLRPAKLKSRNHPLSCKKVAMQMVTELERGNKGDIKITSDVDSNPSCIIRNKGRLSGDKKSINADDNRGVSDGEEVPYKKNFHYSSMPSSISLPTSPRLGIKRVITVSSEEGRQQLLERLRVMKLDQADYKQSKTSTQPGKLAEKAARRQVLQQHDLKDRNPVIHDSSKHLDSRNRERASRNQVSSGQCQGGSTRENPTRLDTISQLPLPSVSEKTSHDCDGSTCISDAVLKDKALMPRTIVIYEGNELPDTQLTPAQVPKFDNISKRSDHLSDCESASSVNLAGNNEDKRMTQRQGLQAYYSSMQELMKESLDRCPRVLADESLSCSSETSSLCNAFDEVQQNDYTLQNPESKFLMQNNASIGEVIFYPTNPITEKLSPVSVLESAFEDSGHEYYASLESIVDANSDPCPKHQHSPVNKLEQLKADVTNVYRARGTVVRQIRFCSEVMKEDDGWSLSESMARGKGEIGSLSEGLVCPKGLESHLEYFQSILAVASRSNRFEDLLCTQKLDSCIFQKLKEESMDYQLIKYIEDKESMKSYLKVERELGLDNFSQSVIFDLTSIFLSELQSCPYPWISAGKAMEPLSSERLRHRIWRKICECFDRGPLQTDDDRLELWIELNLAKETAKLKLWEKVDQLGFEIESMMFDDLVEEVMLNFSL